MMRTKCLFLLIPFLLFGDMSYAQVLKLVMQNNSIEQLGYDQELGLLIVKDIDGSTWGFNGEQRISDVPESEHEREYQILKHDANAIEVIDSNRNNASLPIVVPHMINEAIQIDKGTVFIGTQKGLFIVDSPYPKQFHHPFLEDSMAVSRIFYRAPYLFIANNNGKLFLWNQITNDISKMNAPLNISDLIIGGFGSLWISTDKGLFTCSLLKDPRKEAPIIFLKDIEVNGKSRSPQDKIRISEKDNIKFIFDARQTSSPLDISYKYEFKQKMDYLDENPSIPQIGETKESSVTFSALKKGFYTFKAGATVDHKYYSYYKTIDIDVEKSGYPLWTWVVVGALILILALLAWAKNRNTNFARSITQQRDRLLLENEALKYQQKALQLQMNPHFIFNVLNSIQGLIAQENAKESRQQLNNFSQLMRTVLDQSRDEFITLEDEIKYLSYYLKLEQMCRNNTFDFEITIDDDIDLSLQTLPMVLQPFVENAIVHGLKGIAYKGKIYLHFNIDDDNLQVEVSDNGIGFQQSSGKNNHRSHAMQIVRDRLDKALGKSGAHYSIDSNNSFSKYNPGTTAKINLPLY